MKFPEQHTEKTSFQKKNPKEDPAKESTKKLKTIYTSLLNLSKKLKSYSGERAQKLKMIVAATLMSLYPAISSAQEQPSTKNANETLSEHYEEKNAIEKKEISPLYPDVIERLGEKRRGLEYFYLNKYNGVNFLSGEESEREYFRNFVKDNPELLFEILNREDTDKLKEIQEKTKEIHPRKNKDMRGYLGKLSEKYDQEIDRILDEEFNRIQQELKENYVPYTFYRSDLFEDPNYVRKILREDPTFRASIEEYLSTTYPTLFNEKEPEITKEYLEKVMLLLRKSKHIAEQEKARQIQRIQSPAYLDRLTKELKGNREAAELLQQRRLKNLRETHIYFSNRLYTVEPGVKAHYSLFGLFPKTGKILPYVVYNLTLSPETATHEFSHSANRGWRDIPHETQEEFSQRFAFYDNLTPEEKEIIETILMGNREYYSHPSEILARKTVFDVELEKLGIKKYEEPFTEEHYEKVKKLHEEGKLSRDADQFFRMFKKEDLIYIMNHIAALDTIKPSLEGNYESLAGVRVPKMRIKGSEVKKGTYYNPQWYEIVDDQGESGENV